MVDRLPSKNLLYVKVASELSRRIAALELTVGDKLPSERALSAELGVGRNTVREAIRLLEQKGRVEVRAQSGVFVAAPPPEGDAAAEAGASFADWLKADYIELVEVKSVLEQYAARRLLKQGRSRLLAQLDALLLRLEAQAARGRYDEAADLAFHMTIIQSHPNQLMVQLCARLTRELAAYAELVRPASVWLGTVPLHRSLLDALVAGDGEGVAAAYREILQQDRAILSALRAVDLRPRASNTPEGQTRRPAIKCQEVKLKK